MSKPTISFEELGMKSFEELTDYQKETALEQQKEKVLTKLVEDCFHDPTDTYPNKVLEKKLVAAYKQSEGLGLYARLIFLEKYLQDNCKQEIQERAKEDISEILYFYTGDLSSAICQRYSVMEIGE